MLQMLTEMVRAKELFVLVAFAKLVHMAKMIISSLPIRRVGEFLAAVAADVRG
jgi:hypothetical protein